MRVLVVLPTYNEIENIDRMLEALRTTVPNVDILVVDDGSPDGTGDAADKLAERLGQITVMRRSGKGGLGSAYRAGFTWGLERGYDAFVEIDCDFSHDPRALPEMLSLAENYEVVIGSRYVPGGAIPAWSTSRLLLSKGGNRYASTMLGLRVADSTAGYRVYRKSALDKIDYSTVQADGYGFQIEMTYRARRGGASIIETPISFTDRTEGESKMSSAIVVEALWLVTKWGVARALGRTSFN
jgi:dolichol-phosphate mannosyltransferase